jgi:hypothetical protein
MQLQKVQHKIYNVRNQSIIFDFDLAALYEVETHALNQAVKRNIDRFPSDFMFQLTEKEMAGMSSQFVMTSAKRPKTALPYVFTEQGVAMLSGVLKSKKAISVNISIMRAFVFMRQYALTHQDLTEKLKQLEAKYNKQFKDIFQAISYLIDKDKLEIA